MIDVTPKTYVPNYAHYRQVIERCRQQIDEVALAPFAFSPITYPNDENVYDDHNRERIELLLALSDDFCEADKPLIRWLLRENGKCFELGFDISKETALAAFMLYKYMDWNDMLVLYACKFAYGSAEQYMVDTEIALGFGLQETLDYLAKHADVPHHTEMANAIRAYCGQEMKLKPRAQFIDYFETRRFGYLQDDLAFDYGLIDE